ncbi:DinB family protein [Spirillospora albida]|uniref:DinB family protein n=1 Tax=Spirillospora albida TaxID=58123 RepID=UPI00068F4751|nr:DinB family protein [Spirillospora albida]
MTAIRDSITTVFDDVWTRTRDRLNGLTDDEYFWKPAPNGWTLRPDSTGRWHIDGEGGGGPTPDPVPVATIAWRMGHLGLTFTDFGTRLFHGRNITLDDVDFFGTAAGGVEFLENAYRVHWREPLGAMPDERWPEPSGPAFFAYADHPVLGTVLHVLDEFAHHAAELGVLRDLYPHRPPTG